MLEILPAYTHTPYSSTTTTTTITITTTTTTTTASISNIKQPKNQTPQENIFHETSRNLNGHIFLDFLLHVIIHFQGKDNNNNNKKRRTTNSTTAKFRRPPQVPLRCKQPINEKLPRAPEHARQFMQKSARLRRTCHAARGARTRRFQPMTVNVDFASTYHSLPRVFIHRGCQP